MDKAASLFWTYWPWAYPLATVLLGCYAFFRGSKVAALLLLLSALAGFAHFYLFSISTFTHDWETDFPTGVTYSYQPLGFILANGLPLARDVFSLVAYALLIRRARA